MGSVGEHSFLGCGPDSSVRSDGQCDRGLGLSAPVWGARSPVYGSAEKSHLLPITSGGWREGERAASCGLPPPHLTGTLNGTLDVAALSGCSCPLSYLNIWGASKNGGTSGFPQTLKGRGTMLSTKAHLDQNLSCLHLSGKKKKKTQKTQQ